MPNLENPTLISQETKYKKNYLKVISLFRPTIRGLQELGSCGGH
jgi:hypothetical protein